MKLMGLILTTIVVLSCSRASFKTPSMDTTNNQGQNVDEGNPAINVADATLEECPAGGKVYVVFKDADADGRLDESETTVNRQAVCNGAQGASGANGQNGTDGSSGANGADGLSMVFETASASLEQCTNGGSILVLALDSDRSGVLSVDDSNIKSILVCNGQNGSNGQNGVDGQDGSDAEISPATPVELIMACGETVAYKEVLMRLKNGQVLGSFSNNVNGDMTRLALLPDGTYMNTDTSGCVFTLGTSGDGQSRYISWNNQIQQSWPKLY